MQLYINAISMILSPKSDFAAVEDWNCEFYNYVMRNFLIPTVESYSW
jgi:hypothetical protein